MFQFRIPDWNVLLLFSLPVSVDTIFILSSIVAISSEHGQAFYTAQEESECA